jgi:hypothetical protein
MCHLQIIWIQVRLVALFSKYKEKKNMKEISSRFVECSICELFSFVWSFNKAEYTDNFFPLKLFFIFSFYFCFWDLYCFFFFGFNIYTDTLHTYLLHRLYPSHFKFSTSAEVVDSSRIFVPSGWDSVALVNDIDINNDINLTKFGKLPIGETSIENTCKYFHFFKCCTCVDCKKNSKIS